MGEWIYRGSTRNKPHECPLPILWVWRKFGAKWKCDCGAVYVIEPGFYTRAVWRYLYRWEQTVRNVTPHKPHNPDRV
jgi:hypothetical protein